MGAYKRTLRYDTPTERPLKTAQDRGYEEAPFYAETSMPIVQSAAPHRHFERSREIFAALVCDVTSRLRNESTVLHMIRAAPWRRGASKAQDRWVPRRGTHLRSGQYDNCAKRYSVSSFRAKPRDLCRARMRRNEQAEK